MFCTFYSVVATALLHHVAVALPDLDFPAGWGSCLLLCGAMWALGLTASLPDWLFQRVAVEEETVGAPETQACLLLLSPAGTSCYYFSLLGALAFLPCMLGLGCSFSHVGWLLWTQPGGPMGESIQEHQENTAMGHLPATPAAFVASSLCTFLAFQVCCQPYPLLLPLPPLPGRTQGPLLQADDGQASQRCGSGSHSDGDCPAWP